MNSINNSRHKMEPCGTPDKTVILSEAILSRTGVSEGCRKYHIAILVYLRSSHVRRDRRPSQSRNILHQLLFCHVVKIQLSM